MSEKIVKVVSEDRIQRVLSRICQSAISVLIRTEEKPGVAIRGKASSLLPSLQGKMVRLTDISDDGMNLLQELPKVRIECVMMSSKIVFNSKVKEISQNAVHIFFPKTLFSLERRKSTRHKIVTDYPAFLQLSKWQPCAADGNSMPCYPHFQSLSNYLPVMDISLGGLCVATRFPSLSLALKGGMVDENAKLLFPMADPLPVALEVRWTKQIKEYQKTAEQMRCQITYRFGLEFLQQEEHLKNSIGKYVHQLAQSQAI